MSVSDEIQKISETFEESINKSPLTINEKAEWIKLINSCKETTNGLTTEEKIQKMSENDFMMVGRLLNQRIDGIESSKQNLNEIRNFRDEFNNWRVTIDNCVVKMADKTLIGFSGQDHQTNQIPVPTSKKEFLWYTLKYHKGVVFGLLALAMFSPHLPRILEFLEHLLIK